MRMTSIIINREQYIDMVFNIIIISLLYDRGHYKVCTGNEIMQVLGTFLRLIIIIS